MKTDKQNSYNLLFSDDSGVMCCYRVDDISQIKDIMIMRSKSLHSRSTNSHYPLVISTVEIKRLLCNSFNMHFEDEDVNQLLAVFTEWNPCDEKSETLYLVGTPNYLADKLRAIKDEMGVFDLDGNYQSVKIENLRSWRKSPKLQEC